MYAWSSIRRYSSSRQAPTVPYVVNFFFFFLFPPLSTPQVVAKHDSVGALNSVLPRGGQRHRPNEFKFAALPTNEREKKKKSYVGRQRTVSQFRWRLPADFIYTLIYEFLSLT